MANPQSAAAPPEVLATRDAFARAVEDRDAAAAAELYAADALLLAPQMDWIEGRAAIAAFWKAGLETGIAGIRFEPLSAAVFESVAYEVGRYALAVEAEDGREVTDRGDYLLLHRRGNDGQWRRAIEVMTTTVADEAR